MGIMKQLAILGFLLAILIFSGCPQPPEPPPTGEALELPISERSFELGFMAIPKQPITTDAWFNAFELLRDNGEFVLIHAHIDWLDFVDSSDTVFEIRPQNLESTNFLSEMAKMYGLKTFIVIDPLEGTNREEIDAKARMLSPELSRLPLFSDEKLRKAFKNYSVRIARDYKPEYLGLGSEINTYIAKNPEDAENLISLIKETIPLVKQVSPNTKITVTFQFDQLNGTSFSGKTQWDILASLESKLDLVAISSYPSLWFASPEEIPDNYYSQIKEHTNKPIIMAESGWPTAGAAQYHGSYENQNKFLLRFIALTKDLDLKLWIWWFLHDQPGDGYLDFFRTMGMRTSDGQEKPAWKTWQSIHALPMK